MKTVWSIEVFTESAPRVRKYQIYNGALSIQRHLRGHILSVQVLCGGRPLWITNANGRVLVITEEEAAAAIRAACSKVLDKLSQVSGQLAELIEDPLSIATVMPAYKGMLDSKVPVLS